MFPVSLSRNFVRVSSHFRSICRYRGEMVGQQSLTSYFSPGADRKRRSACQEIDDNVHNGTVTAPSKKKKVSLDIGERLSGSTKFTKIDSSDDVTNNNQENVSETATPRNKSSENQCRLSATMMQVCADTNGLVKNMGPSWFKALQPQFSKDYFIQLSKFVSDERGRNTIFPPSHQVFSWTRTCDVSEVKVVILGQDPYHNVNQAHGFAFSVQKGVTPPPSLVNMYKELETDVTGFQRPGHGDLTGWARQGVLLLNAVLTVRAHNANSHKDRGWEKFTDAVIAYISSHVENVVFILWGAYAQKKGAQIKTKKHLILKGPHPSPLSAHRGFFGCQHFSKANDYLEQHGKVPVNWSDL